MLSKDIFALFDIMCRQLYFALYDDSFLLACEKERRASERKARRLARVSKQILIPLILLQCCRSMGSERVQLIAFLTVMKNTKFRKM